MDILPSGNIFRELQDIHDTGYFTAQPSLEDHWQQVIMNFWSFLHCFGFSMQHYYFKVSLAVDYNAFQYHFHFLLHGFQGRF
ncbi:Krueppel-like factor 6 isoform X1 [Nilaparvata lugens]|uniref:Krueppel-like factor 6 isoform X1 n=1 Tax=Nilaparvata lugens TaxID=108931 RepID=UPI00193DE8FC|nr:Krueppel-like factor 6 isoform X1 [Nilaparvata lugens]